MSISLEVPTDSSVEDGIRLYDFAKKSFSIPKKSFALPSAEKVRYTLLRMATHLPDFLYEENFKGVKDLVERITLDDNLKKEVFTKMNNYLYCGNNAYELKIMYDGTLINCQNHIFERDIEFLPKDKGIESSTKRSLIDHHYFMNPLKDNELDMEKIFNIFLTGKKAVFDFTLEQTCILMYYLAKSHQISEFYLKDPMKLVSHAMMISCYNKCSYNNLVKTGSVYTTPASVIRMLCNGFYDLVEEYYGEV